MNIGASGEIPRCRKNTILASFVVWLATLPGATNSKEMAQDHSPQLRATRRSDMVCGSRCARYLLKYYGHDIDLIALVREIQWPDFEAGATMEAIDSALRARGINTYAMRLSHEARLKWPFPVLLHLEPENDRGHFVVWLPSSSADVVSMWCGLDGISEGLEREWAQRRSGAVLLTAPHQIDNPDAAVELVPWAGWTALLAFGGSLCFGVLLTVVIYARTLWAWGKCLTQRSYAKGES
jgi:ABC-type bacteriocin/lantibiotic exporter with double-glycine peptidase domain